MLNVIISKKYNKNLYPLDVIICLFPSLCTLLFIVSDTTEAGNSVCSKSEPFPHFCGGTEA